MDAFAAHWGLDDETKAYLCSFPGSLRSRVLEQFDPWERWTGHQHKVEGVHQQPCENLRSRRLRPWGDGGRKFK